MLLCALKFLAILNTRCMNSSNQYVFTDTCMSANCTSTCIHRLYAHTPQGTIPRALLERQRRGVYDARGGKMSHLQ